VQPIRTIPKYPLPAAKAKGDQPKWVLPTSPNAHPMAGELKYLEKKPNLSLQAAKINKKKPRRQ
jgi:hypothetical protein